MRAANVAKRRAVRADSGDIWRGGHRFPVLGVQHVAVFGSARPDIQAVDFNAIVFDAAGNVCRWHFWLMEF